jgi:hypothetical protein
MPYIPVNSDNWEIPHPDPSRKYRWISAKPERMSLWLRSYGAIPGYRLERGTSIDATKSLCQKLFGTDDLVNLSTNRIEYGYNVLASIPIEEAVRRGVERMTAVMAELNSAKDEFLAKGEELKERGIRTFVEPEEETASRREFHTRDDRPVSGQTGVGKSPVLRRKTRRARAS